MFEAFSTLDSWLLRTTVSGGVVLLIGTLWMLLTKQPVQRQRIGEFVLGAISVEELRAERPRARVRTRRARRVDVALAEPVNVHATVEHERNAAGGTRTGSVGQYRLA